MPDRHADVLLIGGGVAAAACAAELRQHGFEGSILLVGREPDAPYNRPPCSKEYLRGAVEREAAAFRPDGFDRDVEVLTRTSVMRLDAAARTAKLSSKEEVGFGQALLATGANVRRLNVEGSDLEGVHYLRAFGNADAIRSEAAEGRRAVLVGGSYVGCEVAATLAALGLECTILMQEDVVLERGFGRQVGGWVQRRLEARGVEVVGGEGLGRFTGEDGRVRSVVTESGRELRADFVVMGTGAVPDVMTARGAKLELGETGGVACDATLRTSAEGVWAAGDMCEWDSPLHGRRARVEHWDVAVQQGRTAARNMLGAGEPHRAVPYFWSDLADWAKLEYVGTGGTGEEEVRGSLEGDAFSVRWTDGERLLGCLSVGRADDLEDARRALAAQAG